MKLEKIKLEFGHDDSIARIILDDGKGNILDKAMIAELQHTFDWFKSMQELKLITIEGAGKNFSFGASIEEHQKELVPGMLGSFHQLFYSLSALSIPTLAGVSGKCLGGGMELALMCNFIFADQTARFGQPEILLGVFPPPASIILPQKIGLQKAEELLITGKIISAEEARSVGLINELFGDKMALQEGIRQWIEQYILPKSASSLRYAVKAVRAKLNQSLKEELPNLERYYVDQLMATYDANEGIKAFMEKRTPEWHNL